MNNVTDELIRPLFRSMGLEEYLLDPEVSELMVNNGLAFIDKGGALIEIPVRIDNRKLASAIEIIGQSIGDQIDEYKKPWLDSRLPDGSRRYTLYTSGQYSSNANKLLQLYCRMEKLRYHPKKC